jgi:hypothetical protein
LPRAFRGWGCEDLDLIVFVVFFFDVRGAYAAEEGIRDLGNDQEGVVGASVLYAFELDVRGRSGLDCGLMFGVSDFSFDTGRIGDGLDLNSSFGLTSNVFGLAANFRRCDSFLGFGVVEDDRPMAARA